jgi:hypothetical protein
VRECIIVTTQYASQPTHKLGNEQFPASLFDFSGSLPVESRIIWVWDLGSEIRDPGFGKNLSGSRIQGSKRHRIPDPQHWLLFSKDTFFKTV